MSSRGWYEGERKKQWTQNSSQHSDNELKADEKQLGQEKSIWLDIMTKGNIRYPLRPKEIKAL